MAVLALVRNMSALEVEWWDVLRLPWQKRSHIVKRLGCIFDATQPTVPFVRSIFRWAGVMSGSWRCGQSCSGVKCVTRVLARGCGLVHVGVPRWCGCELEMVPAVHCGC